MGNCQAVDAATLVIQHPSGKVEKLYWPITAAEVMKTNPGHYVALLLSTTLYPPPPSSATATANATSTNPTTTTSAASAGKGGDPVRLTRIKLLRSTDTLTLGHVYRLITNQEVTKGLLAKKQAKLNKCNPQEAEYHQSASKPEQRRKQSSSSILDADESRRRSDGRSHPVSKNGRSRSGGGNRSSGSSNNGGGSSLSAGGAGSGSGRSSRTWQPSLNSILESAGSSSI